MFVQMIRRCRSRSRCILSFDPNTFPIYVMFFSVLLQTFLGYDRLFTGLWTKCAIQAQNYQFYLSYFVIFSWERHFSVAYLYWWWPLTLSHDGFLGFLHHLRFIRTRIGLWRRRKRFHNESCALGLKYRSYTAGTCIETKITTRSDTGSFVN